MKRRERGKRMEGLEVLKEEEEEGSEGGVWRS